MVFIVTVYRADVASLHNIMFDNNANNKLVNLC